VRTGGTTSRLAKGSTNDFVYYNASWPITWNPFVYSGTLVSDTATTTAVATNASPVRQNTNGITIANVALSAGSAGSARFRVSSDGISY
jgi:hypothetical protein